MLKSNAQCYMTTRKMYCYILTPLSSQYTITKCQVLTYTPTSCTLSNMQDTGSMFLLMKVRGTAEKGSQICCSSSWSVLGGPPLQKDHMQQDQNFTETRSLVLNAQSPYQENACHRMHKQEVLNVEALHLLWSVVLHKCPTQKQCATWNCQ